MGSFTKLAAVRSNNHDAITLPRCHTSAISRQIEDHIDTARGDAVVWSPASIAWCCFPTFAARQIPSPLSIGGHETVLNPVVDHLDKMAAPLDRSADTPVPAVPSNFSRPGVRGTSPTPGPSVEKDWIEVLDYVSFATNHHAVAALRPHTTACPHVHVVECAS